MSYIPAEQQRVRQHAVRGGRRHAHEPRLQRLAAEPRLHRLRPVRRDIARHSLSPNAFNITSTRLTIWDIQRKLDVHWLADGRNIRLFILVYKGNRIYFDSGSVVTHDKSCDAKRVILYTDGLNRPMRREITIILWSRHFRPFGCFSLTVLVDISKLPIGWCEKSVVIGQVWCF